MGLDTQRLQGGMTITRQGKRTGADAERCPICDCYRPDPLDPEAYDCMWAVTGNVRDCSEYEDPEYNNPVCVQGQAIPPVLGFGSVGSADERLTSKGQEHLLVWCLSADERRNIFEFWAM